MTTICPGQALAENWAVAHVVHNLCQTVVDEHISDEPWPQGRDPIIEETFIAIEIVSVVESIVDCIANDPTSGDHSGIATVSYHGGFFSHNRDVCQCEGCKFWRDEDLMGDQIDGNVSPPPDSNLVGHRPCHPRQLFTDDDVTDELFVHDRVGWVSQHQPLPIFIATDNITDLPRHLFRGLNCSWCEFDGDTVKERGLSGDVCMWRCCGHEEDIEPEYICTSCTYGGFHCYECGLSEQLYKATKQEEWRTEVGSNFENTDRWSFISLETENDTHIEQRYYCGRCADHSRPSMDTETVTEEVLHISESEYEDEEYMSDVYGGEYENVDPPENNSAKMSEIKDAVKKLGEHVFDIQDKIQEGDYLDMMNLLQMITNVANS